MAIYTKFCTYDNIPLYGNLVGGSHSGHECQGGGGGGGMSCLACMIVLGHLSKGAATTPPPPPPPPPLQMNPDVNLWLNRLLDAIWSLDRSLCHESGGNPRTQQTNAVSPPQLLPGSVSLRESKKQDQDSGRFGQ